MSSPPPSKISPSAFYKSHSIPSFKPSSTTKEDFQFIFTSQGVADTNTSFMMKQSPQKTIPNPSIDQPQPVSPRSPKSSGPQPEQKKFKIVRVPKRDGSIPLETKGPDDEHSKNSTVSLTSSRFKKTMENTKNRGIEIALGILQRKDGVISLSRKEKEEWELDLQYWNHYLDEQNQDVFLLKEKFPEDARSTSPSTSPSKKGEKRDRSQTGKYHVTKLTHEEWLNFRCCPRIVNNLDLPLLFRFDGQNYDVVVILQREIDCGVVEKRLLKTEPNQPKRIIKQEHIDVITRSITNEDKKARKVLQETGVQKIQEAGEEDDFDDQLVSDQEQGCSMDEMGGTFLRLGEFAFTFGGSIQNEIKTEISKTKACEENITSIKELEESTSSSGISSKKDSKKRKREEFNEHGVKKTKLSSETKITNLAVSEVKIPNLEEWLRDEHEAIEQMFHFQTQNLQDVLDAQTEELNEILDTKNTDVRNVLKLQTEDLERILQGQNEYIQESLEYHNKQIEKSFENQEKRIKTLFEKQEKQTQNLFEKQEKQTQDLFEKQDKKIAQAFKFEQQDQIKRLEHQTKAIDEIYKAHKNQMEKDFEVLRKEIKDTFETQVVEAKEIYFDKLITDNFMKH